MESMKGRRSAALIARILDVVMDQSVYVRKAIDALCVELMDAGLRAEVLSP